jgi:hypothetical protein
VENQDIAVRFSKTKEVWSRETDEEARSNANTTGYLRFLRCSGGLFPEQYHRCLGRLVFGERLAARFPYERLLIRINCMAMAICCLDLAKARSERDSIGKGAADDPSLNLTVLSNSFVLDFLDSRHPSVVSVRKAEASFASAVKETIAKRPNANFEEENEHFLVNSSIAEIALGDNKEALTTLKEITKRGDPYFSFFAVQGIALYQCLYEKNVDIDATCSRKTVFFQNRSSLFERKAKLMNAYSKFGNKSFTGLAEYLVKGFDNFGKDTDSEKDYLYCELPCLFTVCERWYE